MHSEVEVQSSREDMVSTFRSLLLMVAVGGGTVGFVVGFITGLLL